MRTEEEVKLELNKANMELNKIQSHDLAYYISNSRSSNECAIMGLEDKNKEVIILAQIRILDWMLK